MNDSILYWNDVALEANKVSHSVDGGEQTGPTLSSRALAIAHLAMHDAYFGVKSAAGVQPFAPLPGGLDPGTNATAAVAQAACTALSALYPSQRPAFERKLNEAMIPGAGAPKSAVFGRAVGHAIVQALAVQPGQPGAGDAGYVTSFAHGRHREDPDNATQGFHAPFYGATARRISVHTHHELADPPAPGSVPYATSLAEVYGKGGAAGHGKTTRTPEETLIGIFWAYDGAKDIGTPPRLYNQVARAVARQQSNTEEENARLFALVNAAMADAGIYAWREKYRKDLWRPVLGVREHDPSMGPTAAPGSVLAAAGDPFWLPLGAPRTNTMRRSFTPPFPAYPSGHATFGAAAFQTVRRFYIEKRKLSFAKDGPDTIAFDLVSDELNGSSTEAPGTVRPRHVRHFDSLWQAIFENAVSRVYLGVHWNFDSFHPGDVQDGTGKYKSPATIKYTTNVGGVSLGLSIANEIYEKGLKLSTVTPS